MRRWEFDSVADAAQSISSWFPGTINEHIILKENLVATIGNFFPRKSIIYPQKSHSETRHAYIKFYIDFSLLLSEPLEFSF